MTSSDEELHDPLIVETFESEKVPYVNSQGRIKIFATGLSLLIVSGIVAVVTVSTQQKTHGMNISIAYFAITLYFFRFIQ